MTEHVAPQEDQLKLPAAWASRLMSRRGRRTGKPVELDTGIPQRKRLKIGARADKLRAALERPENAPHAAAVEAFLAGEPDPHGAAVTAALMTDASSRWRESWLRPEFDFWAVEYGLPFAVAAAVVRTAIRAEVRSGRQGAIPDKIIAEDVHEYSSMLLHELDHGGIAAVRSLLADLTDAAYADVVAAVAPHRDTPAKRLSAMALLPDETAWGLEACTEYAAVRGYGSCDRLVVQSIATPEQYAASGIDHLGYSSDTAAVAALLDRLGADALPILRGVLDGNGYHDTDMKKTHLKAIALIPTDEAVRYLLERLRLPHVFEPAADAATRFPVRALRTVLALTPDAETDDRFRLLAIADHVGEDARARLSDDERERLEGLLAEHGRVPDADPVDLPPLLVTPPWTVKRPKAKPVVIEGLEAPAEVEVRWAEGEQARWAERSDGYGYWTERDVEGWTPGTDDWRLAPYLAFGDPAKVEARLGDWLASTRFPTYEPMLERIVARWGERVADRAVREAARDASMRELPGPILSTAAARLAAERLARLKSARASAAAWFDRHGLDTVAHLVPDALGADKKPRRYAEAALHHLASRHGAEAVAAEAKPYGPEAVAAITALVSGDPLEPRGVKIPKPGAWTAPGLLPQVLLAGREAALPADSVRHLITVLALATPDHPYAGLDVVAEACDRASLARFSRALFEQWIAVGGPAKDGWALTQLAHFAEDQTVWALAPLVREWPGESQHKRAVTGLEVLGAIGSEEAMRAIQGIADKVKFKALKAEASRQIARIAAGLGLSRDQLADRLVPEFGLGGDLVLDYGPRTFTIAFDEALKPYVTDESGKPRKTLPKPGAKDDPDLAPAAYQRFTALKKELRTVAADQVQRLETAMVNARTWTAGEFRRFFVDHALTGHLARRLVWLAETGEERTGFRIAEDGSFSDVEEDTVELREDAVVRVAHPVHLGDRVGAWAEILADYEILQPFEQLSRPVLDFTAEERETGRLARFEGAKVEVGRVLGLTKRGWERATPEDGGMSPGVHYALPSGGFVTVALEPGIYAGYVAEFPEQTVTTARLSDREIYWWGDKAENRVPTGIDPVTASEVLGALARLTGRD